MENLKKVVMDKRISLEGKGIYAILACSPLSLTIVDICFHLGIVSQKMVEDELNCLLFYGYIEKCSSEITKLDFFQKSTESA